MTMKVTSARFVACVVAKEGLPPKKLPIIALVGRSNVGKSSLINILANRRELAKTSSTPGKTLTINFYEFNEAFYLVDLPGYGFAKVSKVTKERIQRMMNEFFESISDLTGVVQVIDVRHPPSNMDLSMYKWIQDQGFRYLPVLTKSDKLGASELGKMRKSILDKLRSNWSITFSAKTKQGREELLEDLRLLLENPEAGTGKARERPGKEDPNRGRRPQGEHARGRPGKPQGGRPPRPPAPKRPQQPGGAQPGGAQPGGAQPEGTPPGGTQPGGTQPTAASGAGLQDSAKEQGKPNPNPSRRRRRHHHRGGKPQGNPNSNPNTNPNNPTGRKE